MWIQKIDEFKGRLSQGTAFLSAAPDGTSDGIPEMSTHYNERPAGAEIPPHTHDRAEVWVFMSGRAITMSGNEIREVTAGDVALTPSGTPHALQVIGSEPLRYYAFNAPPASSSPMVDAPVEAVVRWNKVKEGLLSGRKTF